MKNKVRLGTCASFSTTDMKGSGSSGNFQVRFDQQ